LIAKNTGWRRQDILELPFPEFKAYAELFTPTKP
jgi:hypothetical protein